MCEWITGPVEALGLTPAWKVVCHSRLKYGPFYTPRSAISRTATGWRGKAIRAHLVSLDGRTVSGLHVFKTHEGATSYMRGICGSRPQFHAPDEYSVVQVIVWGNAFPFKHGGHEGWAAEFATTAERS
jgi:hypothetical protein